MGFHPVEVWQFWHGIFRLPCGLCVTELACACPVVVPPEGRNMTANTRFTTIVETTWPHPQRGFDSTTDDAFHNSCGIKQS